MKTVKQAIYEMLTEKTGTSMLDSGGAYGRHWQRNEKKTLKDFENEQEVSFDILESNDNECITSENICYTISLFHYLINSNLKLDKLCHEFNKINLKADNWDSDLYGVSDKGAEYLENHGMIVERQWNSYNGDSVLSQVIQVTEIRIGDSYYVLLQIHQGCDVRGGYTSARLFEVNEESFGLEDVYGLIDGTPVDNRYNGISLLNEADQAVKINKDSKIELSISF